MHSQTIEDFMHSQTIEDFMHSQTIEDFLYSVQCKQIHLFYIGLHVFSQAFRYHGVYSSHKNAWLGFHPYISFFNLFGTAANTAEAREQDKIK